MRPDRRRKWRGPRLAMAVLITAAASALGLLLAAGAATADTAASPCGGVGQSPCPPTGVVTGLPPGPSGGAITVTWTVSKVLHSIENQKLVLTWTPPSPPPAGVQTTFTFSDPGNCLAGTICTYQWPAAMMSANGYIFNGTYSVVATASDCVLGNCSDPGTATPTGTTVANAPATPTGVKAALVHNNSQVAITWDPNPEPDLIGYEVARANQPVAVCRTLVTAASPATSCTDIPTTDGSYQYQVKAYRYGATSKDSVASAATPLTAAVKVTGTAANVTTTTTTPKTGPGALIPPSFNAQPPPGKASSHPSLNASPAGPAIALSPTSPTSVDPGFQPVLPYAQPQSTNPGTTDPAVIAAPPVHKGATSVATIAAIGAGLLVAVIGLHGLWLRSEVRRGGTLEVLDPDH